MDANPFLNAKWAQHVSYLLAEAVNAPVQRSLRRAEAVLGEHAPLFRDLFELGVLQARNCGQPMPVVKDNGVLSAVANTITTATDGDQDWRSTLSDAALASEAVLTVLEQHAHLLNAVKRALDGEPEAIEPGGHEAWQELRDLTKEEIESTKRDGHGTNATADMERLNIWADADTVRQAAERNPQMLEILQAAGRMLAMANAVGSAPQEGEGVEVVGMTLGNDVTRAPADVLARLSRPRARRQVLYDLANERADTFDTITDVESATGPIVVCLDASGSMSGKPNILARGAALAVLSQARQSKRDVYVLTFGYQHQRREHAWLFKSKPFDTDVGRRLISFATEFESYGGTDFMTHLDKAKSIIDSDPAFNLADILFITDGMASLDQRWLQKYTAWKRSKGVCSYLVGIGCSNRELAKLMEASVELSPGASAASHEQALADYVQLLQHKGINVDAASEAA